MKSELYLSYLKDDNVIKCVSELDYQCRSSDGKISVGLYFNCHGMCDIDDKSNLHRVVLTVYPGNSKELKDCRDIDDQQLFMVLADDPTKSYTYKLILDPENESATVMVHQLPQNGREFIPDIEIEGIRKSILPSHKTFQMD